MPVTANLSKGVRGINLADTPILQAGPDRWAVTAAFLHNTASAPRQVIIYDTPDLTSANGEIVANITLAANESLPIEEIIGQSYTSGRNLVAVAQDGSSGDVNVRITYTEYQDDT